MRIRILLFVLFLFSGCVSLAQNQPPVLTNYDQIVTGDEQTSVYFPLLQGKRVAVVANQSSVIGKTNLVDTLLSSGIRVVRIFSPEHGFRGNKSAGAAVVNGRDVQTGLPIISLYGKHRKPSVDDLKNVDVVLFDLQDVGVRFYTYISTLTLVMEACAENNIPLIVLDRPDPNGFYVDGPVLKPKFASFVGMYPVPVVYGMTIGEYARMVNGEHWLKNGVTCDLTVIPLKHYTHNMMVKLPVKPSPNLPDWKAVYLYPSLCFFEGTIVSVGRGTDKPYQPRPSGERTAGKIKNRLFGRDATLRAVGPRPAELPSRLTSEKNLRRDMFKHYCRIYKLGFGQNPRGNCGH